MRFFHNIAFLPIVKVQISGINKIKRMRNTEEQRERQNFFSIDDDTESEEMRPIIRRNPRRYSFPTLSSSEEEV